MASAGIDYGIAAFTLPALTAGDTACESAHQQQAPPVANTAIEAAVATGIITAQGSKLGASELSGVPERPDRTSETRSGTEAGPVGSVSPWEND